MSYSGHIAGFQRDHIRDLLLAEPFRPFRVILTDRRNWQVDDPGAIRFDPYSGQVMIFPYERDGRAFEDWIPLSAVSLVVVLPPDEPTG